MKHWIIGAGLLAASATAGAQSVEVASGNWSNIPVAVARGQMRMTGEMMERMHQLAAQSSCEVRGFTRTNIEMTVPFLIRFTPDGTVERVVVRRLGCPQLESMLGSIVLQLAQAGEYRPTGENEERWYRSELSFVSR